MLSVSRRVLWWYDHFWLFASSVWWELFIYLAPQGRKMKKKKNQWIYEFLLLEASNAVYLAAPQWGLQFGQKTHRSVTRARLQLVLLRCLTGERRQLHDCGARSANDSVQFIKGISNTSKSNNYKPHCFITKESHYMPAYLCRVTSALALKKTLKSDF